MDNKAKLSVLRTESEEIHLANNLYSNRKVHSIEATEEYRLRLARLEQIQKDITELARAIGVLH
jgi:hypothetical protein